MRPRLQQKYREEVIPQMKEKFGIKNVMAVPKITKIVINMGVGKAINDMRIMDSAVQDLTTICGQKPVITRSKEAISNFKLREGMPIGCKVTLRGSRMYEFLDRLITFALPRIRDFNGLSFKSFDKGGNFTLGLQEQSIFPEIDLVKVTHTQGMDITIVFDKGPKEHTCEVLRILGVPFRKKTHLGE
ncbi:MAG: 50S ribosomal protein L5 [Candidatus Omnitrophica bacterium]|nr:50S ribosomal protein L5 [Candidatus Omnitrophota bacterium]